MDKIPYQTLMYMNAVIPEYKAGESGTGKAAGKKRMNLFEMADAVGKGQGL